MTALHAVPETEDQHIADVARAAVEAATRAPSSHNAQPWLFAVRGRTIDLFADRSRGLPVVDPEDRELVMSCGAALLNLRVAIEAAGHAAETQLLPVRGEPDLLARVTIGARRPPDPEAVELLEAIPRRRTNRQPFDGRKVGSKLRARMEDAAEAEGARLHFLEGDDHARLAELVAAGDRLQLADRRFRRELAAWMHPNHAREQDGMRGYGFGLGDVMSHAGPFVVRTFAVGRGIAARDRALAEHTRGLAVLATEGDSVRDWLAAGQALQRVLLVLTVLRGAASFLNQPVEVQALRPRVADLLPEPGLPQLVMRIGYATEDVPASPRRPADDVLLA